MAFITTSRRSSDSNVGVLTDNGTHGCRCDRPRAGRQENPDAALQPVGNVFPKLIKYFVMLWCTSTRRDVDRVQRSPLTAGDPFEMPPAACGLREAILLAAVSAVVYDRGALIFIW